ncbi:MAG: class I SAM-dependent methyltransferase [Ignavibacteria bacterium]
MGDNWYKKWFSTKDYLELYKHRNSRDAAQIAGLITKTLKIPKGSKVLDLACGNGRHSLYFAKKGLDVLGIDLSEYLIGEAKKKLNTDYKKYKDNLHFEIRDMRNIAHTNEFDLVVNLFSSFGYFEKDSENFKVINSISKSLKKGGYFFFDFLNGDYLRKHLKPFDVSIRNHKVVLQVREIKGNAVYKSIVITGNNPKGRTPKVCKFHEMIKLYNLPDFRKVFAKNGLSIIKTFGDYTGSKFNVKSSQRLIILAQKK